VLYVDGYQTQYRSWLRTEGKHISGIIVGSMVVHWLQDLVGLYQFQIFEMHTWRRWGSGLRGSGQGHGGGSYFSER
jgi:hypothetical protein